VAIAAPLFYCSPIMGIF